MRDGSLLMQVHAGRIDRREVLRYAGGGEDGGELALLLDECIEEALPQISERVCLREFEIKHCEKGLDLGFCVTDSASLAKNLRGCSRIILFGATLGIGIDRLIAKYGSLSVTKGLLMQAIGAERIEALCDALCEALAREGYDLCPRFSPGYGDLPLELQRDIFRALEPEKKIGLTLTSSCLMSPTKSVTAIMGIRDEK